MFNAKQEAQSVIQWVRDLFDSEGYKSAKGVVIGISGGKDSGVVAKILVEALGADKVYGVIMPNGAMKDIQLAVDTCKLLEIDYEQCYIDSAYNCIINNAQSAISAEAKINIAPRLRMTTLYALAQTKGYRVAGTGNKSEAYIGYCTKWGDMAHDFNPIADFTCSQVVAIGKEFGLPDWIVNKVPDDGLCGQSDEERIGFSYAELDKFIEYGRAEQSEATDKIMAMHKMSRHKFEPMPKYIQN